MSLLLKLKAAVIHALGFVSCAFIYCWWSRLYRLIWEWKYSSYPVTSYRTIDDLAATMNTCVWIPDSWVHLGGSFSYPGTVQHIIDTQPAGNRQIGDCEEFAVYLANALEQSSTYGGFLDGRFALAPWNGLVVNSAKILTLGWLDVAGNYDGHNVALIEWTNGTFSYMDYFMPSDPRKNVSEILGQILLNYAPDGTLLFWSIHDKDLNFQEVH